MSISTLSTLPSSTRDDGSMSSSHPRADGPRRRRFTPEQKLAHLAAYEEACEQQQGGAYLRVGLGADRDDRPVQRADASEVPVLVAGVLCRADDVGRAGSAEEVMVLVGARGQGGDDLGVRPWVSSGKRAG